MASLSSRPFTSSRPTLQSNLRSSLSRQVQLNVSAKAASAKPVKGGAYVCLECGWVYTDKTPFEDLSSFSCPVCNAPKRRFKVLKGASRGNDPKSMSARREQLRQQIAAAGGDPDEGENEFVVLSAVAVVAMIGAAYYLTHL